VFTPLGERLDGEVMKLSGAIACVYACCFGTSVAAMAAAPDAPLQLALVTPPVSSRRMPDDEELQKEGAKIGHVEIQVDDVFETENALAAP
jgi:hypothetical protein